jgi:hypothetical protein
VIFREERRVRVFKEDIWAGNGGSRRIMERGAE